MIANCIAIIPARSGSKGIIDKNIKNLQGHSMLSYSIAAAKLAGIEHVIISTDSKEYADIAKKYNAEVPFLRPKDLSDDFSTDYDFMSHAMNWYKSKNKKIFEYWVHLRPTTPYRNPKYIIAALEKISNNKNASSLRSGHTATESPYKWFLKDKFGYFKGLKKGLTASDVNLPRQKFPKVYIPNGYVDIVRFSHVTKKSDLHGDRMIVFETPYCIEVDIKHDFDMLNYEKNKESKNLLNWLNKVTL